MKTVSLLVLALLVGAHAASAQPGQIRFVIKNGKLAIRGEAGTKRIRGGLRNQIVTIFGDKEEVAQSKPALDFSGPRAVPIYSAWISRGSSGSLQSVLSVEHPQKAKLQTYDPTTKNFKNTTFEGATALQDAVRAANAHIDQ